MTWFLKGFLVAMLCIASFLPATHVMATTWHVPADIPTIQAALDASAAGDTVLLACGTYLEFNLAMKEGVTLRGNTDDPSCVIIDAQQQGRILDCIDLTTLTRIEGISFTGGYAIEGWFSALGGGVRCLTSNIAISHCVFEENSARIGAGFGASESTLDLQNCTFTSNTAIHFDWSAGGAVWARDCSGNIENCQVITNTAFSENAGNPGDGGGFFFNNNHINVTGCLFQENSTGAGAGGFYSVTTDSSIFTDCDFVANIAGNGGAVYYEYGAAAQLINCTFTNNVAIAGGAIVTFNDSHPTVINCLFEGNQATQWGGGAFDGWTSEVTISGCTFRNNSAQTHGGAVNFGDCNVDISNSLFVANHAEGVGGAIRCHFASVTATGCTMVENSATEGAGIYCGSSSFATVDHSIIAYSISGESMVGQVEGFATISCSDFYGNSAGDWVGDFSGQLALDGNFSADPMFCEMGEGSFLLDANSPCAPGQGGCGLVGAVDVGCSLSAAPENSELPTTVFAAENYPNPFNPTTTIQFSLIQPGPTRVVVFDVAGHLVRTLVDGHLSAQTHQVRWLGRNDDGNSVASGVYFYHIVSGGSQLTGRMALLK